MENPTFHAKVRPELHPAAAELVAIYEAVPGALTYSGAMPEGLAAVLDRVAMNNPTVTRVCQLADFLRGRQP